MGEGKAAELTAPDDEGVFEEAALFEIAEEAGNGGVGFASELAVVSFDVVVAVPAALVFHSAGVDLHKANAAFDHAAGGEALAGEVSAVFFVDAVEFLDVFGFGIDIKSLGRRCLHAVGEFEAFDAGLELGIAGA